jgi:hypothetical protein
MSSSNLTFETLDKVFIIHGNSTLHTALEMICCTKGSWKRAAVYLGGGQPIHIFKSRSFDLRSYESIHDESNESSSDRLFRIVYIGTWCPKQPLSQ